MEIQHRIQNDYLVITPMGNRIDVIASSDFKEKSMALINKSEKSHIIFDLHHVEFIDSAGLVCFLSFWKHMNKIDGTIKFAAMTATVKQIVDLVLLNNVFDIFNTVDDALKDNPKKS